MGVCEGLDDILIILIVLNIIIYGDIKIRQIEKRYNDSREWEQIWQGRKDRSLKQGQGQEPEEEIVKE